MAKNNVTLDVLASTIASRGHHDQRLVVAIAGPPGSGKSTTAEVLKKTLEDQYAVVSQIVPMDGFHYDNAILESLDLLHRKGAPETFDVGGLNSLLKRLLESYQTDEVAIPVFDRDSDLSRASARLINRETAVLLVEGNYLLMNEERWSDLAPYFDVSVMIACDESTLHKRLMTRWLELGYRETEAAQKVEENDLLNARQVIECSRCAEYMLVM